MEVFFTYSNWVAIKTGRLFVWYIPFHAGKAVSEVFILELNGMLEVVAYNTSRQQKYVLKDLSIVCNPRR